MGKINLAKQNQYVEFAQKDSKSRNIDVELDKSVKQDGNGNVEISGILKVNTLTSDEDKISAQKPVVENMTGYSFSAPSNPIVTTEIIYAGIVKNGNKLTLAIALNLTRTASDAPSYINLGDFYVPTDIANKIYSSYIGDINFVDVQRVNILDSFIGSKEIVAYTQKFEPQRLGIGSYLGVADNVMALNQKYYVRYECTILLSDNLAA